MTGLVQDVIRMGNQIAAQFRHLPEDEAVEAVANHIVLFWESRLQTDLFTLVDDGDPDLDPTLVAAAGKLRS
jgi:formate dehydrogenase subunit delta